MRRRIWKEVSPGKVTARMVRTPDHAEQKVDMNDGSFARIYRCKACSRLPLKLDKLTRQIKLAWMEEMTACGKTLTQRKETLDKLDHLKVKGEHRAR